MSQSSITLERKGASPSLVVNNPWVPDIKRLLPPIRATEKVKAYVFVTTEKKPLMFKDIVEAVKTLASNGSTAHASLAIRVGMCGGDAECRGWVHFKIAVVLKEARKRLHIADKEGLVEATVNRRSEALSAEICCLTGRRAKKTRWKFPLEGLLPAPNIEHSVSSKH